MCASFSRQQSRLPSFGAHFGTQKMIFSFFGIKKSSSYEPLKNL
jgi:hypothetical protein